LAGNRRERRKKKAQDGGKQQQLDPFKVYMNAERFRIADSLLRTDEVMKGYGAAIGGPTLVLAAFASELYLKCLFALETGRQASGHELRGLFLLLSEDTRFEIERQWDEYCAMPHRIRVYDAIKQLEGYDVPRDLRWSLKAGNDAFVSLRYIHEPNHIAPKFLLGDFHVILREVILAKKPEWRQVVHGPMRDVSPAAPQTGK